MNRRFVLDTNAVSEPLRAVPNAAVVRRIGEHDFEIAIAAPVWHELLYGCLRLPISRKRAAIERYLEQVCLATFPILPYDSAAAKWHAQERARLTAKGLTPPFLDGQIAAVAAVNDLKVVTRNVKDFERFKGLEIENWWE